MCQQAQKIRTKSLPENAFPPPWTSELHSWVPTDTGEAAGGTIFLPHCFKIAGEQDTRLAQNSPGHDWTKMFSPQDGEILDTRQTWEGTERLALIFRVGFVGGSCARMRKMCRVLSALSRMNHRETAVESMLSWTWICQNPARFGEMLSSGGKMSYPPPWMPKDGILFRGICRTRSEMDLNLNLIR